MDKVLVCYSGFTQVCVYSGSSDPAMGICPCQYFQSYSGSAKNSFCSVFLIYWLLLATQKAEEKKSAIAGMYLDSLGVTRIVQTCDNNLYCSESL